MSACEQPTPQDSSVRILHGELSSPANTLDLSLRCIEPSPAVAIGWTAHVRRNQSAAELAHGAVKVYSSNGSHPIVREVSIERRLEFSDQRSGTCPVSLSGPPQGPDGSIPADLWLAVIELPALWEPISLAGPFPGELGVRIDRSPVGAYVVTGFYIAFPQLELLMQYVGAYAGRRARCCCKQRSLDRVRMDVLGTRPQRIEGFTQDDGWIVPDEHAWIAQELHRLAV